MQEHLRLFDDQDRALSLGLLEGLQDAKDDGVLHALSHFLCANRKAILFNKQVQRLVEVHGAFRREEEIQPVRVGGGIQIQLLKNILFDCTFDSEKLISFQ